MRTQKVSVTLEAEAIERARQAAGPRGLSSYLDAALQEKLERDTGASRCLRSSRSWRIADPITAEARDRATKRAAELRAPRWRDERAGRGARRRRDRPSRHQSGVPSGPRGAGALGLDPGHPHPGALARRSPVGPRTHPPTKPSTGSAPLPTDEPLARHAGALRYAASRTAGRRAPPSGIDAIVAAHAADAGAGVVFTTDPNDLRRLLVGQTRVRVERP